MKKLLMLLPLLVAQVLHAQWTTVEKKLNRDSYQIAQLQPVGNEYYAMAHYIRLGLIAGTTDNYDRYHTPAIQRLDAHFDVIWEKKFPEKEFPTFKSLLVTEQAIYIGGTHFDGQSNEKSMVTCLNFDGSKRFEKVFEVPSCGGSSGFTLKELPDGDIVGTSIGLACSSAAYGQYVTRIHPNGDVVWRKNYNKGRFKYWDGADMLVCEDGNLIWFMWGEGPTNYNKYVPHDLWIYKVNATTGNAIWERIFAPPAQRWEYHGGVRLPNGNFCITGEFKDISGPSIVYRNLYAIFSPNGELLSHHSWNDADENEMTALTAMPDGYYYAISEAQTLAYYGHREDHWLQMYKFDADMKLVDQFRLPATTRGPLQPGLNGTMILRTFDKIIQFIPS